MHVKVTVKIVYDDATVSGERDIRRALEFAVNYLADKGMLSDEESIVDEWNCNIEIGP